MSKGVRNLAAVVALDVAGYSARAEEYETKATSEIADLRAAVAAVAHNHDGRIFNAAGERFMLEFSSSLGAVAATITLAESCDPKIRVGRRP